MHEIHKYLLTIIAAAIVCSIANHLVGDKKISGRITKVISGILIIITVVSPLQDFRIGDLGNYLNDHRRLASDTAQGGVKMAKAAVADIIKEKTEAYILDEADKMDLDISVEVKLSDTDPPTPDQIIIIGTVSPYKKTLLSQYISVNLDIPREKQQWM